MEYGLKGSSWSKSWLDWIYLNPLTCRLKPDVAHLDLMQEVQQCKQFPLHDPGSHRRLICKHI